MYFLGITEYKIQQKIQCSRFDDKVPMTFANIDLAKEACTNDPKCKMIEVSKVGNTESYKFCRPGSRLSRYKTNTDDDRVYVKDIKGRLKD